MNARDKSAPKHESAAVKAAARVIKCERELMYAIGRLSLTAIYLDERAQESGAMREPAKIDGLLSDVLTATAVAVGCLERLRFARSLLAHHVDQIERRV